MSMAVGEYVSVHSQADIEAATLAQERLELQDDYAGESHELTEIYVHRGVERTLATRVAEQLMKHDALAAHARDELGMSVESAARPVQAALASAASFTAGALLPLSVAAIAAPGYLIGCTVATSLVSLLLLGSLSAKAGGAPVLTGALRVMLWSALAMAVTAAAGSLLGPHV
jgi:VIT1/CCC1 family predicted Fe2+/Mn2+ transporter